MLHQMAALCRLELLSADEANMCLEGLPSNTIYQLV